MNSLGHLIISIVKSFTRIGACWFAILANSVLPLAIGFMLAELLGILEEVVDERK